MPGIAFQAVLSKLAQSASAIGLLPLAGVELSAETRQAPTLPSN